MYRRKNWEAILRGYGDEVVCDFSQSASFVSNVFSRFMLHIENSVFFVQIERIEAYNSQKKTCYWLNCYMKKIWLPITSGSVHRKPEWASVIGYQKKKSDKLKYWGNRSHGEVKVHGFYWAHNILAIARLPNDFISFILSSGKTKAAFITFITVSVRNRRI